MELSCTTEAYSFSEETQEELQSNFKIERCDDTDSAVMISIVSTAVLTLPMMTTESMLSKQPVFTEIYKFLNFLRQHYMVTSDII